MYASLGISSEQVYGDMYTAWLRDTHEKNTPEVKRLYTTTIENGFGDQKILLRRQRLGANFISSLAPLLHQCSLVKLDLHGNMLRDVGCEMLIHVLRDAPQLTYLDLGANAIGCSSGLGNAIAQHKRLAVLILGSEREEAYANQIEAIGAMLLLEGCVLSRTLKRLDLSGNPFAMDGDTPSAGAVPGSLAAIGGAAAGTRVGSASTPGMDTAAARGGGAYGMRSAPRTPVQLIAQLLRTSAAGASRTLQHLNLSANGLSSHVADEAGRLLQQRTAVARGGALGCTLHSLVLAHNDLWDNGAAAAQAHRGSLGIGAAAAARPATCDGIGLHNRAQSTTAMTLTPTSSPSKFVDRTRALRDGTHGETDDASHHDQFITTLILDDCVMDDTALYTLCQSLMTNAMLKVLSMRHNNLSPDGVVQLGRSLCRHPCLERLLLSGNAIEDEGACALATALGQPDAPLVELDLVKTWLGDRGLMAIGVALQTNTSLRVLRVSDNHFTHNGGASFAALLESNSYVVQCELGATSVPHHILLRKYKLSEAHLELEALRENNTEVKRTIENFDLQTKQDHSDFLKRIRELEEHIENAKQQEARYTEQKAKLEADLTKAERAHEVDMTYMAERLSVEVGLREKAEAELQQRQRELTYWQEKGPEREAQKREQLAALKADQEAWSSQRKAYRDRTAELQQQVSTLEAAAASAGASRGMPKRRKKSTMV
ncbi:Leucine Rich repeat family protein [Leishmania donovani]|uniref:Leucine Rich repeat family protein n=1 Tax=Leishmania donovani TaxID=5661 RepID=A0A504X787_LEIDO|nr:Leucine Rich repeat family protein [Leishmania donovani]